jgi:hypothetical protein
MTVLTGFPASINFELCSRQLKIPFFPNAKCETIASLTLSFEWIVFSDTNELITTDSEQS